MGGVSEAVHGYLCYLVLGSIAALLQNKIHVGL